MKVLVNCGEGEVKGGKIGWFLWLPQISPIVVDQRLPDQTLLKYPHVAPLPGPDYLDYSDVPSGGQAKRMAIIYNLMATRKFWTPGKIF